MSGKPARAHTHDKRQPTNAGQQHCTSHKRRSPNQAAVHAANQHGLVLIAKYKKLSAIAWQVIKRRSSQCLHQPMHSAGLKLLQFDEGGRCGTACCGGAGHPVQAHRVRLCCLAKSVGCRLLSMLHACPTTASLCNNIFCTLLQIQLLLHSTMALVKHCVYKNSAGAGISTANLLR